MVKQVELVHNVVI